MKIPSFVAWLRGIVLGSCAALCIPGLASAGTGRTPIPSIAGPLAVSASSYPFGRAWSLDLSQHGYVEEEYIVSGIANVYEWNAAGTAAQVQTAGAPYTTRILVIRPSDRKAYYNVPCPDVAKAGFKNCTDAVPAGVATLAGSLPGDLPTHYLLNGALVNPDRWAGQGIAPPSAAPIEIDTTGASPAFVYDANGNMKGGLRTPYVDVPIASYTADGSIWNWSTKIPFAEDKLRSLYQTRKNYLDLVIESTRGMVRDRWITPRDAQRIIDETAQAKVPAR